MMHDTVGLPNLIQYNKILGNIINRADINLKAPNKPEIRKILL